MSWRALGRAGAVAAALVAAALALFAAALFGGELLIGRDLLPQFYPRCALIGEALARGEVPRWNPWSFHGTPWWGPRAGGVLYPGYGLFALLPLGPAMAWFVALHVAWAALGAWRLARADLPRRGAAVAGLAFGLGGFLTWQYWALPYLVSAAWLPWALLGARRLPERPALGVGAVGAAIAVTLLAGEPQGALLAAALAVAWAGASAGGGGAGAGRALASERSPRLGGRLGSRAGAGDTFEHEHEHEHEHARWGKAAGRAAVLALVAVGLAGAAAGWQVLSILDELPRTDRALAGWREERFGAAAGPLLLDLVAPGALGELAWPRRGFWGVAAWGGDVPWCRLSVGLPGLAGVGVALAAGGAAAGERRARHAGLILAGLGLALAASGVTELLGLRYSAKWLVLTALGLALLAGAGTDRLLAPGPAGERARRVVQRVLAGLALAALLVGAFVLTGGEDLAAWFAAGSDGVVDGAAAQRGTAWALLRTGGVAAAGAVLLAPRVRQALPPRLGGALWIGLLALDLLSAAAPGVVTSRAPLLEEPPLARALAAAPAPHGLAGAPPRLDPRAATGRYVAPAADEGLSVYERRSLVRRDLLTPNVGYAFGVRTVEAFESVRPALITWLASDPRVLGQGPARALALVDARHALLLEEDLEALGPRAAGLEPLGRPHPDVVLVRNEACPPWAYLATGALPADDLESALTHLLTRAGPRDPVVLGPDREVPEAWVEPHPAKGAGAGLPGPGEVALEAFGPERVALRVRAGEAAWLVVRDAFSPEWRVELDGEPWPLVQADLLYRAVSVPPGEHRVVFTYAPWWWGPGLRLTAFGWVVLVGGLVLGGLRRARPAGGDATG